MRLFTSFVKEFTTVSINKPIAATKKKVCITNITQRELNNFRQSPTNIGYTGFRTKK
jgi:hypothetical protein